MSYNKRMPKMYEITQENAKEARKLMSEPSLKTNSYRRLEVIALRGEGMSNSEIVKVTSFATMDFRYILDAEKYK